MEHSQNGLTVVEGELEEIDEELTNNLEIIAPSPVRVTFVERDETRRVAEIRTYVPMSVFHQMIAGRQKIMKEVRRRKLEILRSSENDGTEEVREMLKEEAKEIEQEIMISWLVEQVLTVWKRSEPEMTYARLENGLEYGQIEALFHRFFGGLIKSRVARERLRQSNYERG